MLRCHHLLGWVVVLTLLLAPATVLAEPPAQPTIADLELQVAALNTIDEMGLSPEQMQGLSDLADDTADSPQAGDAVHNPAYLQDLIDLRDALLHNDGDKIPVCQQKVSKLRHTAHIVPSITVSITDAAKQKAAKAVQIMSSSQIAAYISIHAEDVPDATQTLVDALDQCHGIPAPDFTELCDEASRQTALLMAGFNERQSEGIANRVTNFLKKARDLPDDKFQNQLPGLEKTARQMTQRANHFVGVQHWMEREMACLLSNPQLSFALSHPAH